MRDDWHSVAGQWIDWVRRPGHDSYERFHRDVFLPLVPPPGRRTLDVGCGEGRVARDLAALGHRVVGLDGSPTLARAAATHATAPLAAVRGDAARLPLPDGCVDCVVAFMSLQDVDDMEAAIADAARVLGPGGRLVMAITHPLNTAGRFAEDGGFVVGSYTARRRFADTVERDGLPMTFSSEHRPLQAYTDALSAVGFLVEAVKEVGEPDPDSKWWRVPLFLDLRAVRG